MTPLICMEHLDFSYTTDEQEAPVRLFSDFNFSVERGSFVALLGRNGSGKSTVARLMNGIYQPTAGRVLVDGIDTADEQAVFEVRSRVGLVFQNPDNQLVATIVEEDVAFGPENLGVPPEEIRHRVDEALRIVGMAAFHKHPPHKLSGGQKQRVAIAGVLAMRPTCIVLDEPTAMLDPQGRREVMDTVGELHRQGITIVLITHDMNEAALADRVVVLAEGDILLDGTPKDIFGQVETLKVCGLEVPFAAELLYELRAAGLPLELGAVRESDCVAALAALYQQQEPPAERRPI